MTPQELKNSILQLAIQGRLVEQSSSEIPIDLSHVKLKKTVDIEFDIPGQWKIAHIETISRIIPAKQYQILESQVLQSGRFPVVSQSKSYSIGYSNEAEKVFRHDNPVVIFGDHTTEVKYIEFDFVVGADGVKIFEPLYEIIDAKFLFYVLQYYARNLSGVGGYSRHYKYIKDKPIPLPPLAEQHRIVAKIEELLPLIDRYGAAWNRLEDFNKRFPMDMQKSLLQMAIQGKLVEQRPEEGTGEELYQQIQTEKQALIKAGKIKKEKPLPEITEDEIPFEIPEGWKWVRFSEMMNSMSTGPFGSMLHKTDYVPDGIPLVNPANIVNGKIIPSDKMMISETTKERLSSYVLHQGMIVLGRRGEMGRYAVVTEKEDGWLCGTGSFFMTPNSQLYVDYMGMLFSTPYVKNYLGGESVGTTMNNLNHTILNRMPIPLPSLAEQKRIVAKLEELLPLCESLK
jgi:type I restriction enzyme S subunit